MFSTAGVFAAIGHYSTLIGLIEFAGTAPVPASLAGYLVGGVISYILNYRFTFRSRNEHGETVAKFLTVAAVGFILNGAVMAAFTGWSQIHYLAAQIVTTGVVLMWSFMASRYWTFRVRPMR